MNRSTTARLKAFNSGGDIYQGRPLPTLLVAVAFLACIVAANYVTENYGLIQGVGGMVTAGTYFAGATFTLRDAIHETAGRLGVVALIILGAGLSWFVAPSFALASGVAFLISETCDLLAYEPLRKRQWESAVIVSGVVGAAVDTWVFLNLANIPASGKQIAAQVATKFAMVLAVLVVLAVRRKELAPA